jgi:transposase
MWVDGGFLGAMLRWFKQRRPRGKLRLEIAPGYDQLKGFTVLPKRWIVERTFGWSLKSHRLCRDYAVRLYLSAAMLRLCMIRLLVRPLVSLYDAILKTGSRKLLKP